MILCIVDDLIFSVKISTAAKALAAPVFFERTPDMVLPRIREKQPSLVIFDLNSEKLKPLDVIAEMKADPGHRKPCRPALLKAHKTTVQRHVRVRSTGISVPQLFALHGVYKELVVTQVDAVTGRNRL